MFNAMIETLKANPRSIVFTEGHDARILEATARLKADGFLKVILVGNVDEVKANAAKGGFDIEGIEILDPATYPEMDAMVEKMVELRKGKMSAEDCRAALSKGNYFGTMLSLSIISSKFYVVTNNKIFIFMALQYSTVYMCVCMCMCI